MAVSMTAMASTAEAKAEAPEAGIALEENDDLLFVGPVDEDFDLALASKEAETAQVMGPKHSSAPHLEMTREEAAKLAGERADRAFWKREIAYQVLNAVDAAQTIHFLDKGSAHEANPILGKYPSEKKIIGFKLAAAGAHLLGSLAFREFTDDETTEMFQVVSVGVQGIVVGWNMQFM
ncbi:hypothetical protein DVR09_15310 (plasmid) [Erythrobacter aureus]|uniref:Uncharacterized protein n=2 Tax=Erythrobacter aureus TaxID=2182384 RepID=A0A345YIS0_9SPHN|nr:hypothetical protein DVR09_15310 [Erythrobacter aureus]